MSIGYYNLYHIIGHTVTGAIAQWNFGSQKILYCSLKYAIVHSILLTENIVQLTETF